VTKDGSCKAKCDDGTFPDASTGKCGTCDDSCATCNGAGSTSCTGCKDDTLLDPTTKSCVKDCPTGYYADTTAHTCVLCNTTCYKCTSATECTECNGIYSLDSVTKKCTTTCTEGYYPDTITHTCKKCDDKCKTCNGEGDKKCTTCKVNTYLSHENTCVEDCGDGFYNETTKNTCNKCDLTCLDCSGPLPT